MGLVDFFPKKITEKCCEFRIIGTHIVCHRIPTGADDFLNKVAHDVQRRCSLCCNVLVFKFAERLSLYDFQKTFYSMPTTDRAFFIQPKGVTSFRGLLTVEKITNQHKPTWVQVFSGLNKSLLQIQILETLTKKD